MKRLLLLILTCWAASGASMLVRVYTPAGQLPGNFDIVGRKPGQAIDVAADEKDLSRLQAIGVKAEILIPDLDRYLKSMAGSYHSLAGIEAFIDSVVTNYPAIAKKYALGTTYEGRTIWALKISDNVDVDEAEPELLFMGLHHAREWPTVEICLFVADTLTRGYGSDSAITNIVNNREVWIVPCVNPDGYHYCHDLGNDWRQNRRYFPEYGTYGVDLNRNYNTAGNGVDQGEWGSINGSNTTHFPDYGSYCGPEPFSEAETRSIRDLVIAHDFTFSVSYHTYSETVMWPLGYTVHDTTPDNAVCVAVGQKMASLITTQDGTGKYLPEQSSFLYPTTGDSDDWLYGFLFYHLGKNLLPYTIEACSDFEPPASQLAQIVRENFDAAFYLLTVADSIQNFLNPVVVSSAPAGPDTASADFVLDWTVNAKAQPQQFRLEQLVGSTVTDSAETDAGWLLNNFIVSSKSKHSGNFSLHSFERGQNLTGSATTKDPVYINPGDSLNFWCLSNIEENYDYAAVEVSSDGRDWTVLEGFTGISDWSRKVYSLEPWAQSSIFIRFRYTVDEGTNKGGFYADDIFPKARYSRIDTLAAAIPGTSFPVSLPAQGTYYYRVGGFNSRGWGDYSPLKRVVVIPAGAADNNRGQALRFRFGVQPALSRGRFAVRYQLPKSGRVLLSVYDASGQMVARPIDRSVNAGAYTEEFRLSLAAGVYFLHFQASGFNTTAKILLVK
jgi:hypothetical protein